MLVHQRPQKRSAGSTCLVAAGVATLIWLSCGSARAGGCPTFQPIGADSQCGTVLSAPGCYVLSNPLQSLVDNQDCITIESSDVLLSLGGSQLSGTGSADTADGIHVLAMNPLNNSAVHGVRIVGGTVESFDKGVVVDAANVHIDNLFAFKNHLGLELNSGAVRSVLAADNISNNNSDGILVYSPQDVITAATSDSNAGSGIVVQQGAHDVLVQGSTVNSNARRGIVVSGSNVVIGDTVTNSNLLDGILLLLSQSARISNASAKFNGGFGIDISNSSQNIVVNSNTDQNSLGGIYLTDSGQNRLTAITTLNEHGPGIEIDPGPLGSPHNVLFSNSASGSNGPDLLDTNPACGTDIWFGNQFKVANPASCIK